MKNTLYYELWTGYLKVNRARDEKKKALKNSCKLYFISFATV